MADVECDSQLFAGPTAVDVKHENGERTEVWGGTPECERRRLMKVMKITVVILVLAWLASRGGGGDSGKESGEEETENTGRNGGIW